MGFPTSKLRYSACQDDEFSSSSFAELLKEEEIISQWFDIWEVGTPEERQELMVEGLRESIDKILELVREDAEIIGLERIVLGGMGQGCATAVCTLLSSGLNLGGFSGWCGFLPFQNILSDSTSSVKNNEDISRQIRSIL